MAVGKFVIDWLTDYLSGGPRAAADVLAAAAARDVAGVATIRRAKRQLGIVSFKQPLAARTDGWYWRLPDPPHPPE